MMKRIPIFSYLLGIALLSNCTIKVTAEGAAETPLEIKANPFPNIAVVTVDSTRKWGKPVTAFAIDYPEGYRAECFSEQRYYLRLRKFSRQTLVQEISIGTFYNVHTQAEAIQSLYELDSLCKTSSHLTYQPGGIGARKIGGKSTARCRPC